ncbi:Hypp5923 [Branchiostoma lanceolatum]|uniref:Hypp5923 protein n=2 Tax=Branchiostoma lanceolatum TaxID=7740 RepID=A0A8J9VZR6_BRALA|nr:Hypp5923 [Branchiostoma lanceolatum]
MKRGERRAQRRQSPVRSHCGGSKTEGRGNRRPTSHLEEPRDLRSHHTRGPRKARRSLEKVLQKLDAEWGKENIPACKSTHHKDVRHPYTGVNKTVRSPVCPESPDKSRRFRADGPSGRAQKLSTALADMNAYVYPDPRITDWGVPHAEYAPRPYTAPPTGRHYSGMPGYGPPWYQSDIVYSSYNTGGGVKLVEITDEHAEYLQSLATAKGFVEEDYVPHEGHMQDVIPNSPPVDEPLSWRDLQTSPNPLSPRPNYYPSYEHSDYGSVSPPYATSPEHRQGLGYHDSFALENQRLARTLPAPLKTEGYPQSRPSQSPTYGLKYSSTSWGGVSPDRPYSADQEHGDLNNSFDSSFSSITLSELAPLEQSGASSLFTERSSGMATLEWDGLIPNPDSAILAKQSRESHPTTYRQSNVGNSRCLPLAYEPTEWQEVKGDSSLPLNSGVSNDVSSKQTNVRVYSRHSANSSQSSGPALNSACTLRANGSPAKAQQPYRPKSSGSISGDISHSVSVGSAGTSLASSRQSNRNSSSSSASGSVGPTAVSSSTRLRQEDMMPLSRSNGFTSVSSLGSLNSRQSNCSPFGREELTQSSRTSSAQFAMSLPKEIPLRSSRKWSSHLPVERRNITLSRKVQQDIDVPTLQSHKLLPKQQVVSTQTLRHGLDGAFHSRQLPSIRRASSALWTIRLMESLQGVDPEVREQVLIKARCFRRWRLHVRLQRLLRQEEAYKLQRAVQFWRLSVLSKCLTSWRHHLVQQRQAAEELCHRHLLRKGLHGLQFAVQQQRALSGAISRRRDSKVLVRAWMTWREGHLSKQKEIMKNAFEQWQQYKSESERLKAMVHMADQRLLSRTYRSWKGLLQTMQKSAVARLHYKVTLLTKCWHSWRMYSAQRIVKDRQNDLARIHYEERLQKKTFEYMKAMQVKYQIARNHRSHVVLVQSFLQWRQHTQVAKVQNVREVSLCKEHYRLALTRGCFRRWRQELKAARVQRRKQQEHVRRALQVWQLRWKRNLMYRRITDSMARKSLKRRVLYSWLSRTKQLREGREQACGVLHQLVLKRSFSAWREHVQYRVDLKTKMQVTCNKRQHRLKLMILNHWRAQFQSRLSHQQARDMWSLKCVRKAIQKWRYVVHRKHLEVLLVRTQPLRDHRVTRAAFSAWVLAKRVADHDRLRVDMARQVVQKNRLHRMFTAWRILNQETQTIAPLAARRKRREIVRYWDAWRWVVLRKQRCQASLECFRRQQLYVAFSHWHQRVNLHQKQQAAETKLDMSKARRAFQGWRGVVERKHELEEKEIQHKAQALKRRFLHWQQQAQLRELQREVEHGNMARARVLLSNALSHWQQYVAGQKKSQAQSADMLQEQRAELLLRWALSQWKERLKAQQVAKEFRDTREEDHLRHMLRSWNLHSKESFRRSVEQFNQSLLNIQSSVPSSDQESTASQVSSYESSGFHSNTTAPQWSTNSSAGFHGAVAPELSNNSSGFHSGKRPSLTTDPSSESSDARSSFHRFPQCHAWDADVSSSEESCSSLVPAGWPRRRTSQSTESTLSGWSESVGVEIPCSYLQDFLTSAILRWRHWPVSVTFSQWKEFVRQQKELRQKAGQLQQRCAQIRLKHAFREWRHSTNYSLKAHAHRETVVLSGSLRAWLQYTSYRRRKAQKRRVADRHAQDTLVWRAFCTWKNKANDLRRLQKIVEIWQGVMSENQQLDRLARQVQEDIRLKNTAQCFQVWVWRARQLQQVARYHQHVTVKRHFQAWLAVAREQANRREKCHAFRQHTLRSRFFQLWNLRLQQKHQVEEKHLLAVRQRMKDVLVQWRCWAVERRIHRAWTLELQEKQQRSRLHTTFRTWRMRTLLSQRIKASINSGLLTSCFLSWQHITQSHIQERSVVQDFQERHKNRLVSGSFHHWRNRHGQERALVQLWRRKDRAALEAAFDWWRQKALEGRCKKHRTAFLLQKTFSKWQQVCEENQRRKERLLGYAQLWHHKTQWCKDMEAVANQHSQQKQQTQLKAAFAIWQTSYRQVQLGQQLFQQVLVQKTFHSWLQVARARVYHKNLAKQFQSRKKLQQVSLAFHIWRNEYKLRQHHHAIVAFQIHKSTSRTLHTTFQAWRNLAMSARADKFCQYSLQKRMFQGWRTAQASVETAEQFREEREKGMARLVFQSWRHCVQLQRDREARKRALERALGERTLRSVFDHWRTQAAVLTHVNQHSTTMLQTRALRGWRDVVRRKRLLLEAAEQARAVSNRLHMQSAFLSWQQQYHTSQERNAIAEQLLGRREEERLRESFRMWAEAARQRAAEKHHLRSLEKKVFRHWKMYIVMRREESRHQEDMEDLALQHYNQRLCNVYLRAWHREAVVCKHLRSCEKRKEQKSWGTWKSSVDMAYTADQLFTHNTYHRVWTRWRKEMGRRKAIKNFTAHEEKQTISQVFQAWHKWASHKHTSQDMYQRKARQVLQHCFNRWCLHLKHRTSPTKSRIPVRKRAASTSKLANMGPTNMPIIPE